MAVVSESSVLSHHSMADNLLIGDSENLLTEEYLEDVSKETHLHEFVSSLPNVSAFGNVFLLLDNKRIKNNKLCLENKLKMLFRSLP